MPSKFKASFREAWFLVAAIALMLSPALFDLDWLDNATAEFTHTRDAGFGVIGVLITAALVNAWHKKRSDLRDSLRYDGMSKVAFRSLAQTVNDVGRMLLAPVVGADLHASGIPGFTPGHHEDNMARLRSIAVQPDFRPRSGVWDDVVDLEELSSSLVSLCAVPGFPEAMFRTTSDARRRLQSAMAAWAPVMVTVPGANESLSRGWPLADQIVLSLESWRRLVSARSSEPTAKDALDGAIDDYVETIRQYRAWIQELIPLAGLPSRSKTS